MKRNSIITLLTILSSIGFNASCQKTEISTNSYSGPYLGLTQPGLTPIRFGSNSLIADGSWHWNSAPSFSPDGKEMFFAKWNHEINRSVICTMKEENSIWNQPQKPDFIGLGSHNSPIYSYDGNTLYFISMLQDNRMHIFYSQKGQESWTQPQELITQFPNSVGNLGATISITKDETIYLEFSGDIYRSVKQNGLYNNLEKLPQQVNSSSWDGYAAIDPNEQYIIFSSYRNGGYGKHDLYISFRNSDGTWTNAKNMGNSINGTDEEGYPQVTVDGKFVFFVSLKAGDRMYNAYWVDAEIVNSLR